MNATEFPASDDLRAIRYRFDGPVAIVELHRPHRANAWNGTMHGEFLAVMRHIETLDDVIVFLSRRLACLVGQDPDALILHRAGHGRQVAVVGRIGAQAVDEWGILRCHQTKPEALSHDFRFGLHMPDHDC